ncbi:hypothetical protein D3C71_1183430 [compost metagenome]
MGDRRIGQQAFEVMLEDRVPGADQQGDRPDAADRIEEQIGAGQRRVQPCQQEHAGFDHRRRMQVGRDRRRGGHRVRQPEVERELGALGEDAGQDQEQGIRVQRTGADQIAGGEHRIQFEAAHDAADQQHAAEQGQAAAAGDHQGHPGTLAGILTVRPEADQQERADAGHFPEHHQQQQVAREHHAQHGAHEQQQVAVETVGAVAGTEVVVGVHHHQRTDGQHHAGEHPGQAVQAQREGQADLRYPLPVTADDPAVHDGRGHRRQQRQSSQRSGRGYPGGRGAGGVAE